jgi:hypothetical protein
MQRQVSECSFDHADDLLTVGQQILDVFDKPKFIKVFEERLRRLDQCIETEGDYV